MHLHQHLPVLATLLSRVRLALGDFFFEHGHHFVDVACGDEVQHNVQRLASDVQVGRRYLGGSGFRV